MLDAYAIPCLWVLIILSFCRYVHGNGDAGIAFLGSGESPESSETSIEVNNVKSNHNGGIGMKFGGSSVKLQVQVKDSETSNNGYDGISIEAAPSDVELDGIISRYNQFAGVALYGNVNMNVNMKVKGDVNLYKNGDDGIFVFRAAVVVERRGALNSCGNGIDIGSNGGATFSGNGYTCTNPPDSITCDPCPTCPSDGA